MMQGVVLHGTGRKAVLDGYSAAGKTGTAQKVDPATGVYSRTKYVASFAGFAPINNPAITVAVILDSPVGILHQGGQVAAPVFQTVTQQVMEYLHVPHDVELSPNRQVLLAARQVKEEDLAEISPDHLGATLEVAESNLPEPPPVQSSTNPAETGKPSPAAAEKIIPASRVQREFTPNATSLRDINQSAMTADSKLPSTGTVILEVEQGGMAVPSFLGKTVRGAIEAAEESGLELDAVGSGIARDQSPSPGSHVAAGSRVVVRFER